MVDVGFRVVRYLLLEEICFPLQRDHIHEAGWIGDIVHFVNAEEGVTNSIYRRINVAFMPMSPRGSGSVKKNIRALKQKHKNSTYL